MSVLEWSYELGLWLKANPDVKWYAMGGLGAMLVGSSLVGRRGRPPQTTHGSARWATPKEIRAAGFLAPYGVVVGRLGKQVLHDDSETHNLLIAPTRSWKGIGPIGGTLVTWLHSVLVNDPADGENYDGSHTWREAQGQRVEQFTPRRSPHACINVCDLIRKGKPQEFDDAWMIAASLLSAEQKMRDTTTSVHFRRQCTLLLTAGQLHLTYAEPPASLGRLWWLLTQRYQKFSDCIKAMQTTEHTAYGVHRAISELSTAIANISSDRELSGVFTTATGPLLPYADYLIQKSTDTSTIKLEDLQHGTRPMSLYLVAPKTSALDRLAPVYRVISDMAMQRLQEYPPRSAKHRLLVLADEAPAYGYSLTLDKGAAEAAKYGIKIFVVAQDVPQITATFGEDNSLFGNTATKIFFAPDNYATAKYLSESLGEITAEQPVLSKPQGFGGRPSVSYQQVGRPLMTADELRTMHPQAAIVFRTNLKPILCGKVNCLTDPEYRGRYTPSAA